jgi:hypothetical protein
MTIYINHTDQGDDNAKLNMADYLCVWEITGRDCIIRDLALRYHAETEEFDRTVCTGPMRDGVIMPIDHQELAIINRNAMRVRKLLMTEAAIDGITSEELARSISRYSYTNKGAAKIAGAK